MKKIISLLLSLLICLSVFAPTNVIAVSEPTILIVSTSGKPGDTVNVEIALQNNPGIAALQLQVGYDNTKLQLTKADDGELLGTDTASFGNIRRVPYSISWDDSAASSNHTENGAVAVLSFLILDTAEPGDTEITVSVVQGGTFNLDLDDVVFQTVNGVVTIQSDVIPAASLTVSNVTAKVGDDVDVPITIENNPGMVAMLLSVSYDTGKLQLTGVTDGTVFGSGNSLFSNDYTKVPYKLLWENGTAQSNYTENGTLAILHFHVLESNVAGSVEITLQYTQDSTFDVNFNEIPIEIYNGQVTIEPLDDPPEQIPAIIIEGSQNVTAGETVVLPIKMQNNPGLIATAFSVEYDSDKLELISADTATDIFPSGSAVMSRDLSRCPFKVLFEDGISHTNYVNDGTLVTLTFHVKQDAAMGESQISLLLDEESTFDTDINDVSFQVENAVINICENAQSVSPCVYANNSIVPQGTEFTMPVCIRNNPGIIAMLVKVNYDPNVLTLVGSSFENSSFPAEYGTCTNNYNQVPFYLLWEQGDAITANDSNGNFAYLRFFAKQDASATETSVQFEVVADSTLNIDLQEVHFETKSATVKIDTPIVTCDNSVLYVGQTEQMQYAYRLGSSVPNGVYWSSKDNAVASVSATGLVTALNAGTTNITATDTYGNTATITITIKTEESELRIFSFEGSFEKKVKWWKRYATATMMLGFNSYNCDDAVRYEWSSDNWRVSVNQKGNITNSGSFARSAKITLTAYDADGNVVASSTVTVRFYKFNWQRKRLQSQEIVSDNVFKTAVESTETEPETFSSILSAFFSKVFWFISF